jgi:hypothetical protein
MSKDSAEQGRCADTAATVEASTNTAVVISEHIHKQCVLCVVQWNQHRSSSSALQTSRKLQWGSMHYRYSLAHTLTGAHTQITYKHYTNAYTKHTPASLCRAALAEVTRLSSSWTRRCAPSAAAVAAACSSAKAALSVRKRDRWTSVSSFRACSCLQRHIQEERAAVCV